MLDSLLDKGRRDRMVKSLSVKMQVEKRVLDAIGRVPRHMFVDSGLRHFAYEDKPLSIHGGQTISQPSTVALQTGLLSIKPSDKILEVGTGCGYQTAILEILGGEVYSIERIKELHDAAERNLKAVGCFGAHLFLGDGYEGLPQFAPFDKIIVTCAANDIPNVLARQLRVSGKMIVPVQNPNQQLMLVERISETEYNVHSVGDCSFVPMLHGVEK